MRARRLLLMLAVLLCCVAARRRAIEPPERDPIRDVFSASNPTQVTSTHLALDLTVDFNAQILRGSVTHTLSHRTSATQFIVDTNGLDIDAVTVDGKSATWTWGETLSNDSPLRIDVTPTSKSVRIDYRTRSTAGGLQWLKAPETRSRTLPAMWSENEPDKARTWIPLQDTPAVRITYGATIHTTAGELALMSAPNNPTQTRSDNTYTFSMPHSIPSYLIALTVGAYGFRATSDRTGIYAEPNLLDDSVYETQYVPDMVQAAERVLGPYPFERYDLVFPPKYTGGMENPELNFIGQDFITGNHPSVLIPSNLIAHELAHSWFGDLLTCGEWNDLWLNEGFATYFGPRIVEEIGARDLYEYILNADRGALDSYLALKILPRFTVLHYTFIGSDRPAFTVTNYQKGDWFLYTLETHMGRSAFDAFIGQYVDSHRFRWVDDVEFRSSLLAAIKNDPDVATDLAIDEWIYGTGMPSNASPAPMSSLLAKISAQANAFRAGTKASDLDTQRWTDFDRLLFLGQISDVIIPRMSELDTAFGFSKMNSPPPSWLTAAAKSLDSASKTLLDRYLAIGKTDSLVVWQTLARSAAGRTYGVPLYNSVRNFYDASTRQAITSYFNAPL